MVVADKYNHFSTLISVSKDYSKVFNSVATDTLGSKYAFMIYNGDTNHYKGNVSCIIHKFNNDNCTLNFDDYATFRIAFIDWMTNKRGKLLKFDDGTSWLIGVSGNPSCSQGEDENGELAKCSFEWNENGDANNSQDYINNGLI